MCQNVKNLLWLDVRMRMFPLMKSSYSQMMSISIPPGTLINQAWLNIACIGRIYYFCQKAFLRCPHEDSFIWGLSTFYFYFSPRWKHSHRGGNYLTAVKTISPQWEHYHHGGNIPTAVRLFPPRWKVKIKSRKSTEYKCPLGDTVLFRPNHHISWKCYNYF